MELFLVLFRQLIVMMLFMVVGYFLYKGKKVTAETNSALSNLLLFAILPCAIVNSFLTERTAEKMTGLGHSFLLAVVALAVSICISLFVYKKQPAEQFGVAFSNVGFMGIPIITAAIGAEAVFYVASFVALLNVLQQTFGVVLMSGDLKAVKPKKLLTIPVLIAMVLGILLFVTRFPVPQVVRSAVASLAAVNGPLAMVILGVFFAQVDIKEIFTTKRYYHISVMRLIIIPVITGLILWPLPGTPLIKLVALTAAAAPIGSNVSIFAKMYGQDYKSATQEVCQSTIFAVITMPAVVTLFSLLYGYAR